MDWIQRRRLVVEVLTSGVKHLVNVTTETHKKNPKACRHFKILSLGRKNNKWKALHKEKLLREVLVDAVGKYFV
jgi:hypothetical protein